MRHFLLIMLGCCCGFATAADLVPVQVMTPQSDAATETLPLTGSVRSAKAARLSARTEGLVAKVLVDAGAEVQAGQVLLQQDDTLARHQLAQLQASLSAAETMQTEKQRLLNEAKHLTSQQLFPQTELAIRQAALAQAIATTEQAAAAVVQQAEVIKRHQLIAPFQGVIAAKLAEAGEWVDLGSVVLELVSQQQLWLDVQVPQEKYQDIQHASRIQIRSDMAPQQELNASVHAIVPVSDANARSFLVRLSLPADQPLLPGTSATATFYLDLPAQRVVVPADALLRHPDGSFSLFTVSPAEGNAYKASRHLVKVGRTTTAGVELLSVLPAGAAVVIRGNEQLQDQQLVQVVPALSGG